ncbi:MAG TPA: hypothetical protein VFE32_05410 [Puia sp.]|jgi:hypothetical protein|nr:hypothetical protein [Puia sp.]
MHIFLKYLGLIVAVIPCIAGLVRFRRLGKTYQPLFFMSLAGLATEATSDYLSYYWISNAGVSNTYALLEWMFIFWQFRVWGAFRTHKELGYIILIAPCIVWVAENLIFGKMANFSPFFRIFACFLIVLFSVNKINFMITHDNRKLLGHPEFLICIGFIIYFIYDIVYEWAYQSSARSTATGITSTIIYLFNYINALTNIIFAIAFLRIQDPRKYTLW